MHINIVKKSISFHSILEVLNSFKHDISDSKVYPCYAYANKMTFLE